MISATVHGIATLMQDAADALAAVSPGALAIALLLHVFKVAAEARSWHGIVAHTYRDARFRVTLGAFAGSLGANVLLPARIGDALRLGIVRKRLRDGSGSTIAATMVVEAALETAFSVAVVVAVLVAGRSVGSLGTPAGAVGGIAAHRSAPFVAAALAVAVAVSVRLCRPWLRRVGADMRRGFAIMGSPGALGRGVVSWKLIAWTLRLGSVYFFLVAFHVPGTAWTVLLVVAAQAAASLIPLLPGNAGAQQAALVVGLAGYATAASVVALGIGMQAATGIVDLVLGGLAVGLVANTGDLRALLRGRQAARY
jgi:glycosyltransferase 2 family protein